MTSAEEAEIEHPGKVPFHRVGLRWGHRIRLIAHGIRVCMPSALSLTSNEPGFQVFNDMSPTFEAYCTLHTWEGLQISKIGFENEDKGQTWSDKKKNQAERASEPGTVDVEKRTR